MKRKTKYKLTTLGISQLKKSTTSEVALQSGRSIPAIYSAKQGKDISLDTLNRLKDYFKNHTRIDFSQEKDGKNIYYETIELENSNVEKETI
jgi:hypothetical protein